MIRDLWGVRRTLHMYSVWRDRRRKPRCDGEPWASGSLTHRRELTCHLFEIITQHPALDPEPGSRADGAQHESGEESDPRAEPPSDHAADGDAHEVDEPVHDPITSRSTGVPAAADPDPCSSGMNHDHESDRGSWWS